MDIITHPILGAACSYLILGKRDRVIPVVVGGLAALVPDMDVFISFFSSEPLSVEYWHRHFSHSIIFIPFAGLLITFCCLLIPYCRKQWKLTLAAAIIGVATHGLLDACTSYGTLLYWPWSTHRISWDLISIIDPVFTIILCIGTAWSIIFHERKLVSLSLILAGLFLVFNNSQHQRALKQIKEYAHNQKLILGKIRAIPALGSSTHWRVIAEQGHCYLIANVQTPLLNPSNTHFITRSVRFNPTITPFKLTKGQKKEVALFSWFSDGYLIIASYNPFILADGRYTFGNSAPIKSLWSIELTPNNVQVKKANQVLIKPQCN